MHSHLLPGIDDGAESLDAALDLARFAVDNGIRKMVLTPHIHHGRWDNNQTIIDRAFEQLQEGLIAQQIELTIERAAEVRIAPEIMVMVKSNQLPFIGEWESFQVLLLELPHSHIPPGTDKFVQWLLKHKIKPMIAHPERNKEIMRDFNHLTPLVQLGCLFQVTAASVAGQFGEVAQQISHQMLRQGDVTIIATDAHNLKARPPDLDAGYRAACEIIGEEAAHQLVFEVPEKLTRQKFQQAA
ncbi:MAG TPA: capsular biosynthesis protein [Gammaproteobacteria bacterium]|nr:capsular biosynthesis protein [Gammaproteobacteria bacterium]